MAGKHSYTITIKNIESEKEAIQFLLDADSRFVNPDKESRKEVMRILGIEKKYSRAFDLLLVPEHTSIDEVIRINDLSELKLVELKTTKKKLNNNPYGFFFGATQNEFDLAESLPDQYLFCFVSLHPDSRGYKLFSLEKLNQIIRTKRIQYQINIKS